jgi:Flp pilus assembly protein TadD
MVRKSIAVMLFLLLMPQMGIAQGRGIPSNFSIGGRIVVPLAGFQDYFEVLLLQNAEQVVAHTYADSNGRYRFTGLTRGTYFVNVKLDGFEEVRQRVDLGGTVGENIVNIILDFKQERIVERPPDFTGEDREVVDIADLSRKYPGRIIDQYEDAVEDTRAGNLPRAEQRLLAVIAEAPDFYFAHKELGSVYQKLGRFRDAETAYKQARDLRPASASPLLGLGSLYIQEVESGTQLTSSEVRTILDEALDHLEAAIKLKPDAAFAYYLAGIAYYRSAFYEDAEEHLKRALFLESRLAHARLALANVYVKMEEWPEALAQLDAFLRENPKAPERAQVESVRAKIARRLEPGSPTEP